MARIGIAVTKEVAFRDSVQEFTNVYYYENGGSLPDATAATALIDEVVTEEKLLHSTAVTFKRGRCWSQVGSAAQNNMLAQKVLTGTGSAVVSTVMDRERAFLFRWRAGNDSRGNPVYLRKYYHTCGVFPGLGGQPSDAMLANISGFSDTQRNNMATSANAVVTLAAGGGGWELVAKGGRQRDTGFSQCHKYLEHHQLGDMWRG